jgi:hypothetical protein
MGYQNDPNLYLYARNNPLNFVDRLGLDPGSYSPGRGGPGNGGTAVQEVVQVAPVTPATIMEIGQR